MKDRPLYKWYLLWCSFAPKKKAYADAKVIPKRFYSGRPTGDSL